MADVALVDAALLGATAEAFVRSGRVVPSLRVEADGRVRSWWWPLPAADDRAALAELLPSNDAAGHAAVAAELAAEVDRRVRSALSAVRFDPLGPQAGRRTLEELWVRSLVAADPWLPASVNLTKAAALGEELVQWVREAMAGIGAAGVSLRLLEPRDTAPNDAAPTWRVEPMVHDIDDPSLIVAAAEVFGDRSPFDPAAAEAVLAALGRAVRVAPELAPLLEQPVPGPAVLDDGAVTSLLRERVGPLNDVGVAVAVPSWWTNRRRLGVRAHASTKDVAAVASAGFGFDEVVSFTWQAALGDQRLSKADLAGLRRASEAKRTLVQVRGEWVELQPAHLAAILAADGRRDEARLGDVVRTGLGLPTLSAPAGLDVVGVSAAGVLGRLLMDPGEQRGATVSTPAGFAGELRPYQQRGVGWLTFLGRLGLGACLADDMGLGKTAQLLATILADPVAGPTLVVCPTSVLGNWERELARFTPSLRVLLHHGSTRVRGDDEALAAQCCAHDVVLTSYGLVARDLSGLRQISWGRLVLDEAQQVKNPYTAQAKAIGQLRSVRRIAMTGTPVENRLSELWAIMTAVNPGLLGTVDTFKQRFAIPIEREGDDGAAQRLQRLIGPFVLRRLKTDKAIIADLPDKVEITERCPLTREQATLYQAVVDELVAKVDATDGAERRGLVLAGIMKLKQLCNHPAHFLGDGTRLAGRSGKLIRTEELLDELLAAGDKALCFTQFAAWGELLQPYLGRRFGVPVLWLHGGTPRRRRDEIVADFQSMVGPAVFLLSLKAGGTGLNLTAASHVLHLDRWWNPAVEDQATDRAFRIGQRQNVFVHKLVATGTIEDRIDEMITRKRVLAGKVVGTGERWITELSTDELRELLTYDPAAMED